MDLDDFLEVELSTVPQEEDAESDTRSEVSNDDSMDSDAANASSEAILIAAGSHCGADPYVHTLSEYGSAGMAAATALLSSTRRSASKEFHFETNPAARRRHQTRLLRKIRALCHEYCARVGQQAVFVAALPAEQDDSQAEAFKIIGSSPLDTVIRSNKQHLMKALNAKLTECSHSQNFSGKIPGKSNIEETGKNTGKVHFVDLPCLSASGIPVALNDMTQAMLRNFIPVMLKHATGRGKPGWGVESLKPIWWPDTVIPWVSVRSDTRSEEQKCQYSWTFALKELVRACYKHHDQLHKLTPFPESKVPAPSEEGTFYPHSHPCEMNVELSQIVSIGGRLQLGPLQLVVSSQPVEPLLTDLNCVLSALGGDVDCG